MDILLLLSCPCWSRPPTCMHATAAAPTHQTHIIVIFKLPNTTWIYSEHNLFNGPWPLLQPRWVGLVVGKGDKIYGLTSNIILPRGELNALYPWKEKMVLAAAAATNLVAKTQQTWSGTLKEATWLSIIRYVVCTSTVNTAIVYTSFYTCNTFLVDNFSITLTARNWVNEWGC